ncbi:MAG: formylglycine-generating enzyme family protein [Pirellulales bacterium]
MDTHQYARESSPDASWAPRNWPLRLGRRGFRLPSEAEWEVANRAGSRTSYCFGGDSRLLRHFCWYNKNSKNVHQPMKLRPNSRGLFDMHGNLVEWTHDWYGLFNSETVDDPLGPIGGANRVYRGGSWNNDPAFCRSGVRNSNVPTNRSDIVGFRLALYPSSEGISASSTSESKP